ncbi:unnamed protein product, partial [Rotaria sp. Silwood2]
RPPLRLPRQRPAQQLQVYRRIQVLFKTTSVLLFNHFKRQHQPLRVHPPRPHRQPRQHQQRPAQQLQRLHQPLRLPRQRPAQQLQARRSL